MLRNEAGQSAVEFILMFPFVLLMLMAIAEFGAAFYMYVTVNNATSEAARWAATAHIPDPACADESIQWRAREMSQGMLECDARTVFEITYEDAESGEPARGTGVTVRVERTYTALTPLPGLVSLVTGGIFPASWQMSACSDARLERRMPTGVYVSGAGQCGS